MSSGAVKLRLKRCGTGRSLLARRRARVVVSLKANRRRSSGRKWVYWRAMMVSYVSVSIHIVSWRIRCSQVGMTSESL